MKYFLKITMAAALLAPLSAISNNMEKAVSQSINPLSDTAKFKVNLNYNLINTLQVNTEEKEKHTLSLGETEIALEQKYEFNPIIPISFGKIKLINDLTADFQVLHGYKAVAGKKEDTHWKENDLETTAYSASGNVTYKMYIASTVKEKFTWGVGFKLSWLPVNPSYGYSLTEEERKLAFTLQDFTAKVAAAGTVKEKPAKLEITGQQTKFQPQGPGYSLYAGHDLVNVGRLAIYDNVVVQPGSAASAQAATGQLNTKVYYTSLDNDAASERSGMSALNGEVFLASSYTDQSLKDAKETYKLDTAPVPDTGTEGAVGYGATVGFMFHQKKINAGLTFDWLMYADKNIHELNIKPIFAYTLPKGMFVSLKSDIKMSFKSIDLADGSVGLENEKLGEQVLTETNLLENTAYTLDGTKLTIGDARKSDLVDKRSKVSYTYNSTKIPIHVGFGKTFMMGKSAFSAELGYAYNVAFATFSGGTGDDVEELKIDDDAKDAFADIQGGSHTISLSLSFEIPH